MKKRFESQLEDWGEITNDDELVCPHCFIEGEDTGYRMLENDRTAEVGCDHCGKKFNVTLSVTYTYTTTKIDRIVARLKNFER